MFLGQALKMTSLRSQVRLHPILPQSFTRPRPDFPPRLRCATNTLIHAMMSRDLPSLAAKEIPYPNIPPVRKETSETKLSNDVLLAGNAVALWRMRIVA